MLLAHFAHDLFDRGDFGVRISENNWDGIRIAEIKLEGFGRVGDPEEMAEQLQGGV